MKALLTPRQNQELIRKVRREDNDSAHQVSVSNDASCDPLAA